ncbi:MAG: DUF1501 domain-containing protein [Pirellulales bacterium]
MTRPGPEPSVSHAVSRRCVLRAGGIGLLGLGWEHLLAGRSPGSVTAVNRGGGPAARAKSCIFLFMWGGPSQLDTFDMKPDAPAEVRSVFDPVSTSVPGLQICEHFERLAPLMDRVALVRSLAHNDPAHLSSAHATLTGHLAPVIKSDAVPPSQRDTPHIGAVMSHLRGGDGRLPPFVTIPWRTSHPAAPGGEAPGQLGGWLGSQYDPFVVSGDLGEAQWRVPELALEDGVSIERLDARRAFLQIVDRQRSALFAAGSAEHLSQLQKSAFGMLAGSSAREAFDLSAESAAVRDCYGRNRHGQAVLLARRLVERGVPLVSVNWHNDGKNFWDTHGNNFNRLKDELIPPADQALAALLTDLEERGLLEETLVVWVGEFGRRPQITQGNAGREHWPRCYSGLLAGGGIAGGAVYGASDKLAAYPVRDAVSPLDFAATIYHALGVSADLRLPDAVGRPTPVCQGQPILDLLT